MKLLIFLFLCIPAVAGSKLDVVYVNHELGSDLSATASESKPLKTFKKAFSLVKESGVVYIQKTEKPYTEKLVANVGGTLDKPLRVLGAGAVIDLSTDISSGPWKKEGEYFIFDKVIKRSLGRSGLHQMAALWVNRIPIHPFYHKYSAGKQKTYVTYLEDGKMKVKFPAGIDPRSGNEKVKLNADFTESAVSFGHHASNIVVDGITVKHSGNDGFNLHGKSKGIHLTNVVSLFNGDEGISAHGQLEMKVSNSIVAHNGSSAGGIADVGECTTDYKNCLVYNNNNCAFFFSAVKHSVSNCLVWGNKKTFSVRKSSQFSKKNIYEFKDREEAEASKEKLPIELQRLLLKSLSIQSL